MNRLILCLALPILLASCASEPPPQRGSLGHFGPPTLGGSAGSPISGGFSATGSFRPVPAMPQLTNDFSGGLHGQPLMPSNWKGFSGQ